MKKFYTAVLAAFALAATTGCNNKGSKPEVLTSSHEEIMVEKNDSNVISGTYKGTLPCADCGGKNILISLSSDGTYHLEYEYLDKGEGVIEENGTYIIFDNVMVKTITPSSGDESYYKYVNGNLVVTDSTGMENDGALAELYVLKKVR